MLRANIKTKIWLVVLLLVSSIAVNIIGSKIIADRNSAHLEIVSGSLLAISHAAQSALAKFELQDRYYEEAVAYGDIEILQKAVNMREGVEGEIESVLQVESILPGEHANIYELLDEYIEYCIAADYIYGMLATDDEALIGKAQGMAGELQMRRESLKVGFKDMAEEMKQALKGQVASVEENTRIYNKIHFLFSIGTMVVALLITVLIVNMSILKPVNDIFKKLSEVDQDKEVNKQLYNRHRLESLGELAGGVAKEVDAPIVTVKGHVNTLAGYAKMLEDVVFLLDDIAAASEEEYPTLIGKLKVLDEREDFSFVINDVERILNCSEKELDSISEIVSNLVAFASPDGKALTSVNPIDSIKSALRILRSDIEDKCKIYEDYQLVSDLVCYPGELNLIFMSIIKNALQAVNEDAQLYIKVWEESGFIITEFKDNGCGMSESDMETIFDPFYSTLPFGKGMGLGLAVTHSIVERHGGKITVDSDIGQGAIFRVELPVISQLSRQFESEKEQELESQNV